MSGRRPSARTFGPVPDRDRGRGTTSGRQASAPPRDPDRRHLPVLDALSGGEHVSQRTLSRRLELGLGVVNRLLRELLEAGFLKVEDRSVRPFAYRVTPRGWEYRRYLARAEDRAVLERFRGIQGRILGTLLELRQEDVERIVLYGAGQIMEVTLPLARFVGFEVLGVVDDDAEKQGGVTGGLTVRSPDWIPAFGPEAVLITTFRHAGEILEGLDEAVAGAVRVVEL